MKAAFIEQTGPAEKIRYGDLPEPRPGAGEVLVRVEAVAVNPIDTYIRSGAVAMALPKPFVVGCDLAGTVAELGSGVDRLRVGDRVWGSNQGLFGRQGTFAEWAAVGEQWLHPLPAGVSFEDGAACALVGITAHLGLRTCGRLSAGETILVQGATGGVGWMVMQMAKAIGARVIATAGTAEKAKALREAGADVAVEYGGGDFGAEVKRAAPEGVDVWWEVSREPDFERVVPLLAKRGRLILMAGRDARPVFPVGPFYVKNCSMHGFAMFNYSSLEQQGAAAELSEWLSSGTVRARVGRVLRLEEAAAAHRLQEENTLARSGTLSGKIVLKVRG